jgi:amidase
MTEIAFQSAGQLLEQMASGATGSRALLDLYLDRIERFDGALNAVVALDVERARKRADEADAARTRGECWGPLHGLPVTVKDCIETAGLRTTCGSERLATHVPTRDAAVVERLVRAGAVIFGKTNTPEFTADWQTSNAVYGTTNNPWDTTRSPGGSSGGSAAAIAAGFSALDIGSDIGGSIRIPAHCCGIFGHKPSWGVVPQRGHIPGLPGSRIETDLNVIGPLARSAGDLELALDTLAGPNELDARGWRLELPPARRESLRDFRIAAWLDDPACSVDSEIRECLEQTVEQLRKAGARVDDRARPACDLGEMVRIYRRLLAPVMSVTFDDAQFAGLQAQVRDRAAAEGDESSDFLHDAVANHHDWLAAHEAREQLRVIWDAFFRDYDVLLCPVAATAAIPHDHSQPVTSRSIVVNGEERSYMDHLGWMGPFGALKLPASVAPAGRTAGGLPIGVQIVGPYLEDRTTIAFARLFAQEFGGFENPPGVHDVGR